MDLVSKTGKAFEDVAGNTSRAGRLVAEIASGSSEQAQGIEQMNLAATETDGVVQHTAANAEGNAQIAEEMNSQAEQMKHLINELIALVKGGMKRRGRPQGELSIKRIAVSNDRGSFGSNHVENRGQKEVNSAEMVPLDDKRLEYSG